MSPSYYIKNTLFVHKLHNKKYVAQYHNVLMTGDENYSLRVTMLTRSLATLRNRASRCISL